MIRFFKEIGKGFFIGSIIFLVMGIIIYATGGGFPNSEDFLIAFMYNQLYSVVLYMGNMYYFRWLLVKYENTFFLFKNLLKSFIGAVFITIVSIFFLRMFTELVLENETLIEFLQTESISSYYVSLIISVVVTSIFYVVFYYQSKQDKKIKEQKIIAGTASAKFDALKNQLDPHFLFNSLNVLTSLIEENPEAATRFTTALSKVYRYVLEQKNKDLVTVEEELKFAQLYMSLLEMRFEDSIVFTVPTTLQDPQAKVVPLALQLLLENAVKHNRVMPSKKLHITIQEVNGSLVVTNNLQPKQVVKESSGVGLKNIVQRYALLTNRPVAITENRQQFKISIPLLTKETMTIRTQDTYISEKRYASAKAHVEKLKGFYIHFGIYCVMIPVFIYINYISGTGFPWAIFPILGWGFGVMGHASETFNYNPFFGKNWEERKIKQLMDKEK